MFVTGKTLAQMWPNLGSEKKPRSCAKTMAPLSLCEMIHQMLSTFLGMKCPYLMASAQKNNKPMELRRKPDKKTWNPLQNAKRHRIHKRQKGNAATFKYPPSGMIIDDYRWLSRSDNHLGNSYIYRRWSQLERSGISELPCLMTPQGKIGDIPDVTWCNSISNKLIQPGIS